MSSTDDLVEEIVVVDQRDVAATVDLAAKHGANVEVVPQRGIEPITTATLIVVGTAVAVGVVLREIDGRKGGQVIDLRPGAPREIYRDRSVQYGLIVVFAQDGQIRIELKEPHGTLGVLLSGLTSVFEGLGSSTADEVASLAQQAIGDHGTVSLVNDQT